MGGYFCTSCVNLKLKLITKETLGDISKYKIRKAIKEKNIEFLGFEFPFNLTVYNRLRRHGECEIIYCSENLLNRDLYIYRDLLENCLTPDKNSPCSKYK